MVQFLSLQQKLILGMDSLKQLAEQGRFGVVEWLMKHNEFMGT